MANSANTNTVPKLYRSVIEDVINDVRDIFLDDGVDEQVLMELKTLWENKLMQSRAVDGFHSEDQQLLLQVQQQHQPPQPQHHHHHHHQQAPAQSTVPQQAQTQQVLIPASQQAAAPQVIVPDSKLIQHMNASNMSAAATAATLALPAGVTPVQQILTNSGQLLQVVRAANGAQYIFQPQQSVVLQQQVIPQMQPGGVQAPVIQQVLAPLPGGISPQTGVIIQPQQILFTGNKTQVIPTTVGAPTPAQAQITAAGQQQPQAQTSQPQAPLVLQVDGTGDTSSEEDEDEEEDYDDDEEEDKEKDGAEDGQVEEVYNIVIQILFLFEAVWEPLNSEDDVSDEEGQELFDTENVVVCQYDKIHRSKNKWKFHLKDGIMNLNGRDYIFSKAIGDAEW
ncbi:transcription initiation factor IIA subunit 1 isoform X1 [Manis javanica]|uniref:transcription initiation factor IIA subunit 1 isoform X1 n=2 Tax=Manis javanica TaxID=9974 RepID=UPI003C6CEC78